MYDLDNIRIYGYTLRDLIIVAELYFKKEIILEDTTEAFARGYEIAKKDNEEAMKQYFNNLMNGTG